MAQKLRRMLFDKRGITPVLSNLLLTVVAVAAMAIATTATYVITTNLKENMSERLIAEDVWFSNPGEVNVYLHNIGKIAIRVSAVYINHTSQSFTPLQLEIGGHGWLNISYNWVSGNLYYIDIVTTRGTHIADYYSVS
ncbi:MAG: hypothetical protein QXF44_03160 [Candidatus Bathyarchaeia archaeon]